MIMVDKDKMFQTLMKRRRHEDGSTEETQMKASHGMMAEGGEVDPRHSAAEDVMHAVHERHPGKLLEAMANFHDLHEIHRKMADTIDKNEPS